MAPLRGQEFNDTDFVVSAHGKRSLVLLLLFDRSRGGTYSKLSEGRKLMSYGSFSSSMASNGMLYVADNQKLVGWLSRLFIQQAFTEQLLCARFRGHSDKYRTEMSSEEHRTGEPKTEQATTYTCSLHSDSLTGPLNVSYL